MKRSKQIKIFIYSRIFGLILMALFLFTLISNLTYSSSDPFYGFTGNNNTINNFFGFFGAYYSGTVNEALSILSYVVPLFFFIIGLKKIAGIKTNFFVIHLFSFLIGLISFNILTNLFFPLKNQLGKQTIIIFENNFEYFTVLMSNYLFVFFLFILSLIFLLYGLSIKIKNIFYIIKWLTNLFFKIFKINKFFNLIKYKKIPKEQKTSVSYFKTKREPTIYKNDLANIKYKSNTDRIKNYNESNSEYDLPPTSLLRVNIEKKLNMKEVEKLNQNRAAKLEEILKEYGVNGKILGFSTGPIVTLFEFLPAPGIKTSKVVGLTEDIGRSMSSMSTRISSQPGKSSIGIEVPNNNRQNVFLGDLMQNVNFSQDQSGIMLALGKNISGQMKFTDLEKMPHLLIAGTTGSGKSVGINCMILSILFKFKPSECKLILVDPKMLELSVYEDIPHLLTPVVTDPKKAVFALRWVVKEMENRYRIMSSAGVKNIQTFNAKIEKYISEGSKLFRQVQTGIDKNTRKPVLEKIEVPLEKMPLIVVVIDEMADLMMVAGKEVESLVQRLAQMARASGIHLITATQRPSVDVITGTIKANFPSRLSYRVASKFDSRTILNEMGAEQLLGSGDMLFLENGTNIVRLHGAYVSEEEIHKIVRFINSQSINKIKVDITTEQSKSTNIEFEFDQNRENVDDLYEKAVEIVVEKQKASTSLVQRYLQIGYNRAARIIEQMEKEEIISEANHVGKRSVLKNKN